MEWVKGVPVIDTAERADPIVLVYMIAVTRIMMPKRRRAAVSAMFKGRVSRCRELGLSLAGVVQHQAADSADRRCDVLLEDLTSDHRTALFEDRGAGARGCRLDESALAEAAASVEASLENAPHLLVLNKFGKVECDGGGLRDLIASAIDRGILVIIGVPQRNIDAWRSFAGEFAIELSDDACKVERWLKGLR